MKLLVLCSLLISVVNCANILVVYPMPGPSHYILGNAVVRTLVEAGHDVSFIAPFKEKNPPKTGGKWTDIYLDGFLEESQQQNELMNLFKLEDMHPILNLPFMNFLGNMIVEKTLNHTVVRNLLKSNQKFDVVIIEQFYNDALKIIAHHFKAPLIIVSSMSATSWVNDLVANPGPPSYVPDIYLSYSQHMTFCERVKNTLFTLLNSLSKHLFFFPSQNQLLQQYVPNAPPLNEILYNISLVFLNSHISTSPAKPLVPNMIEIGGYHVNPPKKLPEDLQKFLDSAKEGAIYFSMGSNLKSADMPEEKLQAILKSLSKLKQKVLWKFEKEDMVDLPSNVKISKWLPQQDILAHPNVKLFITHGGLLSATETIYHGVPNLVIPIFGDQKVNAAQTVLNGFGVSLPYKELTEETLTGALNEVLNNPKYYQNAKKRSQIMHDRQVKPRENLVYWTEYVIRHKGAPHLRVAGVELAWYQYLSLDVYAFLGIISLSVFIVFCLAIKWCCKRKSQSKDMKKVKKN